MNQKLGLRILNKMQHDAALAENGKVALDMILSRQNGRFDVVLMDCQYVEFFFSVFFF